jgi:hypothetical protein
MKRPLNSPVHADARLDPGWQLNHGDALDPGTVERSLRVMLDRTPTLVMIAHP